MQDFNQTTHVGTQELNVFNDNISFLFFYYHFYKKFNETVTQWYIMAISTQSENTHFKMQNACFSTWSFSTWIAQQFQNGGRQ